MRGGIFNIPNPASLAYIPGPQPFDPGNSVYQYTGSRADARHPWPPLVPSLLALANNAGHPRDRAIVAVNNRESPRPENYFFISGFVGKSKG